MPDVVRSGEIQILWFDAQFTFTTEWGGFNMFLTSRGHVNHGADLSYSDFI